MNDTVENTAELVQVDPTVAPIVPSEGEAAQPETPVVFIAEDAEAVAVAHDA
jgi:hypothetical protein